MVVEDDGRSRCETYWSLPRPETAMPRPRQQLEGEIRARFDEAVRRRLVSDVPLGAFLSGGMWTAFGHSIVRDEEDPRLGNQRSLELWGTLKPTSQLRLSLTFQSFRMNELRSHVHPVSGEQIHAGDEIYEVYIGRARLTYQFTKNLFVRVVTQYVDSDDLIEVDPLISYKLNPFTVFFLGSSHNFMQFDSNIPGQEPAYKQTDRTYFIKFQYLFRV